jgi:hypothetical protein
MRHGNLKRIRSEANKEDIAPAILSQGMAIHRLCPDHGKEIQAGKHKAKRGVTWSEETRKTVWEAYRNWAKEVLASEKP